MKEKINNDLFEYGLEVSEFFITNISLPEDDKNFNRMRQQYADQYLRVREEDIRKREAEAAAERKMVEAQTEARLKIIGAQADAQTRKMQAEAEAQAYKMQAEAEASEMRMKGYTYQQETARLVGRDAMKNGITGNGSGSSGIGELAGLGVTLGAMGGVMNMTKDTFTPFLENAGEFGREAVGSINKDEWECKCGNRRATGKFCNECGSPRPEKAKDDLWDCQCGNKGIRGKFCNECGSPRPEKAKDDLWDCQCGNKGIKGKFCNECGSPRPQ